MSLSETRFGADVTPLPGPVPLPSLTAALSRRAALFGAVSVVSAVRAIRTPAEAQVAVLSTNDARLVAIAAELRAVFDRTDVLASSHRSADTHPEWNDLIDRFEPFEDEMAEIAADSLVGVLAKARALQIPTCRDCARPELGNSLADDLVRLSAGALS